MGSPERSVGEKLGTNVRNGGIIAGILGIILSPELFAIGAGAAISGEILKKVTKKK